MARKSSLLSKLIGSAFRELMKPKRATVAQRRRDSHKAFVNGASRAVRQRRKRMQKWFKL